MPPHFLPISEVANILGISCITVYRHAEAGTIPSVKIGSRRLVPAAFLAELEARALGSKLTHQVEKGA
jgi:excisionase family DNA binding protein